MTDFVKLLTMCYKIQKFQLLIVLQISENPRKLQGGNTDPLPL